MQHEYFITFLWCNLGFV